MVRSPTSAVLLICALLAPALACTPVPSKSEGGGDKAAGAQGPAPEQLCKHVRDVAGKDNTDAAVLDQVERECVETLTGLQGRYATFATCVDVASDRAALLECEASLAKPRSLLAAAGPGAKIEAVCDHVLGMLQKELGQTGTPIQETEVQQLREQCVKDATTQVEAKGLEAFEREATCILEAQTIEALQA